jgi:hypothetical protein
LKESCAQHNQTVIIWMWGDREANSLNDPGAVLPSYPAMLWGAAVHYFQRPPRHTAGMVIPAERREGLGFRLSPGHGLVD